MKRYPFKLIDRKNENTLENNQLLNKRPFINFNNSFSEESSNYIIDEHLEISLNTSIALGEPLLLTGESGTGKTQIAYHVSYRLNLGDVIHFQVKSDSKAKDLLYYFDAVRYFYDAQLKNNDKSKILSRDSYVEKRHLWQAISSKTPRVLLIDEIDKAPRDFPNDLLFEIDQMEFEIIETQERIKGKIENRPIIIITSNSERQLPEAFLRRCVYHHIEFSENLLREIFKSRKQEFQNISDDFLELTIKQFLAIRRLAKRKKPSTAEFLVWLRVISLSEDVNMKLLEGSLSDLPYIGVLLKDREDYIQLKRQSSAF